MAFEIDEKAEKPLNFEIALLKGILAENILQGPHNE
jgi:hypothetical protein